MKSAIESVFIVGSGNVAFHLANGLARENIVISGIFSRNHITAKELAATCACDTFDQLPDIPASDLVLFCVPDDVIPELVSLLKADQPFAYTSGAFDLSDIPNRAMKGVFYPLQTFSRSNSLDLTKVPFFVEASDMYFQQALFDLAWRLSRNVKFADSSTRKRLHVAAVLVNNFTNHLVFLSDEFLSSNNLSMSDLLPLLEETITKLHRQSPRDAQTGPARRGDVTTIQAHERLLTGQLREIYQVLTKSIMTTYNSDKK